MKHLKSINELNKSTYVSAARKLSDLGGTHLKRAKEILKHSDKFGIDSDIHNIDSYPYYLNASWRGYSIDDTYTITDTQVKRSEYRSCIDVTLMSESNNKTLISVDILYYDEDGNNTQDFENANMEYEEMWINFYDEDGEFCDDAPGFLFSSRKDAIEFKNFIVNEFGNNPDFSREIECFKKVRINKLFS